ARRGVPRLPDVPGAARHPRPGPARTGARPGDGARPGRAGPGRPEVGRADGAVQPARLGGRVRLDGNADVHRRARAGALAAATPHRGGRMRLKRLVPMQPVADMPASVAFYEKLGFTVASRNDDWGWARMRCGDCEVMLDQSIRLHEDIPRTAVLYLYPDD